jgi:hypothetical protein
MVFHAKAPSGGEDRGSRMEDGKTWSLIRSVCTIAPYHLLSHMRQKVAQAISGQKLFTAFVSSVSFCRKFAFFAFLCVSALKIRIHPWFKIFASVGLKFGRRRAPPSEISCDSCISWLLLPLFPLRRGLVAVAVESGDDAEHDGHAEREAGIKQKTIRAHGRRVRIGARAGQ